MANYKKSDIERKKTESIFSIRSASSDLDSISLSKDLAQEDSNALDSSNEKRKEIIIKTNNCTNFLQSFSKDPLNFNNEYLRTELISILKDLNSYKQKLENQDFDFSYIEYIHYLYKLDKAKDLPEYLQLKLEKSKFESNKLGIESFVIYETFNNLLILLSRLMVKMNIFDIHNYRYRFKGRSLTILFFNMAEINKQCLSIDIIWMSYAVNHMPFKKTFGPLLLNYSKILKHCLTNLFSLLLELSETPTFLQSASFELVPFYMRLFKSRTPDLIHNLHSSLTDLEKSYRCFERALLEESLKMV